MSRDSGRSHFQVINGKAYFYRLGYNPEYGPSLIETVGVDKPVEVSNLARFLQEWEARMTQPMKAGHFGFTKSDEAKKLGLSSEAAVDQHGLFFTSYTYDHGLSVAVFTPYERTKNKEALFSALFPLGTPLGVVWGKVLTMIGEHVEFMMGGAPFKLSSKKKVELEFRKEDLQP